MDRGSPISSGCPGDVGGSSLRENPKIPRGMSTPSFSQKKMEQQKLFKIYGGYRNTSEVVN